MNHQSSAFRIAAVMIAVVVLGVALVAGHAHEVLLIQAPEAGGSIEWDFYYSYARDAKRIASLLAPLDEFRGPFYPLLLALAHGVLPFLSLFASAKLISALSAAGAVLAAYLIAEEAVEPVWGLAVAAATAVTSPFLLHGFLVGTDMFFACLCLFTIYLVLRALAGNARAAVAAGALAGLAMTTRWNAAFLPAAALASFALALDLPIRERARLAARFAVAFAIPVAPWLALNAWLHGNPFFNRNYTNLSLGIYDGGLSFGSLSEAVAYAPRYVAKRWAMNVVVYAGKVGTVILPLAVFAGAGLGVLLVRGRQKSMLWALVIFCLGLFAINAIGPFVVRQYLVAIPLFLVAAAAVVERVTSVERWRRVAGPVLGIVWFGCLLWIGSNGLADIRSVEAAEQAQLTAFRMVGSKVTAPLLGDWDGDGRDEPGLVRDGNGYTVFYLYRGFSQGPADWIAAYGPAGAAPLAGRWRGGADAIGVFKSGAYFLKNEVFSGYADTTATLGAADGLPVTGDWNGDGRDTVGTFRNGMFALTDQTSGTFEARMFAFGSPGDRPVAGDWDGDGVDTVGVYRDGVFTLTNRTAPPFDDAWQVRTDPPGAIPLAGDLDGDGRDAPALYTSDGTFFLFDGTGPTQWKVDLSGLADLPVAGE